MSDTKKPKTGRSKRSRIKEKLRKISPLKSGTQEDAVANSAAMAPLLPTRPEDSLSALKDMAQLAISEPTNFLGLVGKLAKDQVSILTGQADYTAIKKNRRFKDKRWQENPFYHYCLQSWASLGERSKEWLENSHLDDIDERRLEFFLSFMHGALSPANFPLSNPEAFDATLNSRGKNLFKGINKRLDDIKHNHGIPAQVSKDAYALGKDIALTPGAVVYRGELFELLQYSATTEDVLATPLLAVSPYINRAYLMDLTPERSFVSNMVNEGHSTFLLVWKNPKAENRHWGHQEYADAVIEAGTAVREICSSEKFNLAGLCSGGQIATLAASILEAENKDWINSLTLMVNVLDGRPDDTEMGLICSEKAIKMAKAQAKKDGVFKAGTLLWSFNLMKPDDLIWSTWVDYYLLDNQPGNSEVMFWMNDQVNVAEKLYCEQLDNLLHNNMAHAGKFDAIDPPLDLSRLKADTYILAAFYDHIMPWPAVYRTRKLLSGNTEFVLTNGGHITPCITAANNKRSKYFTNSENTSLSHEEWLASAQEHDGSWLTNWGQWLQQRSSENIKAPKKLGSKKHPSLMPAPGSYGLS